MIKAGLIGYGYWGPNIARNFSANPEIELAAVCDFSPDRLRAARLAYPYIKAMGRRRRPWISPFGRASSCSRNPM